MKSTDIQIKNKVKNNGLTNTVDMILLNITKEKNTMSKTKQYYTNEAENQVDKIIACMKSGQIDEDKAKKEILNVDNVNMLDIDEHNIDDVIYYSLNG